MTTGPLESSLPAPDVDLEGITEIDPYGAAQFTIPMSLPVWGISVWLQDANGGPVNTQLPGSPDISFAVGNSANYGVANLLATDPTSDATTPLVELLLSGLKSLVTTYDWTSNYDWASIGVATPVTVAAVKVTRVGYSYADQTPPGV